MRAKMLVAASFAIVIGASADGGVGAALHAQSQTGPPLYVLDDNYLHWPLPASAAQYGRIDGRHLKPYVDELTAISRKSRDAGNQYWGRITGTPYDAEAGRWLEGKFRKIGLDTRVEPLDLPPLWFATGWELSVAGGDRPMALPTAQPAVDSAATPSGGLELDAAWVGLGAAADFMGRDVRGRAVFIYSITSPGVRAAEHSANWYGAIKRATDNGAAAIVLVLGTPGNVKTQMWPVQTSVPFVSIGMQDGDAVRELIERSAPKPVKVRLRVDTKTVSGLKTASVWGVLPGATDENILVMAHFDGYFEAAMDNASGVATMLGLAEYFAAMPKEQRRRRLTFAGYTGHHERGEFWGHAASKSMDAFFAKTALVVNSEHTSLIQTYPFGRMLRKANATVAVRASASGSKLLPSIMTKAFALFGVPTYEELDTGPKGELRFFLDRAPGMQIIESSSAYHTDMDRPEMVPPTGLEAMTRAFATIIDEVNRLELRDMVSLPSTSTKDH